jgi:hypothetical protein
MNPGVTILSVASIIDRDSKYSFPRYAILLFLIPKLDLYGKCDSPSIIANSKKIALGDKNATEPIILGNRFLNDFEQLCRALNSLGGSLTAPVGAPGLVSPPVLSIPPAAVQLQLQAAKMLSKIKQYKSTLTTSKYWV